MSNKALAIGSSAACSGRSYERVTPQVSGSRRMNFIALGFGVGSISAIFGMVNIADAVTGNALFGGSRVGAGKCRVQRMPRQDGALHPHRQVAYAGEYRQAAEVMWRCRIDLAGSHVAEFLHHLFGVRP